MQHHDVCFDGVPDQTTSCSARHVYARVFSPPNIVNSFAEHLQSRATCKTEFAHQGHVNMSCAQEVHHRRDLQGAGQCSCTSVANLISCEGERGDCAIILCDITFRQAGAQIQEPLLIWLFLFSCSGRRRQVHSESTDGLPFTTSISRCPQVMKAHSVNLLSQISRCTPSHTLHESTDAVWHWSVQLPTIVMLLASISQRPDQMTCA